MRYDEFRDRWQAALRTARLLAHHDRPEETIDLTTTERRWRVHPLSQPLDPFHAGATISFRWDPFDSARSYTCEEDLLTELVGRRGGRSTAAALGASGRPLSGDTPLWVDDGDACAGHLGTLGHFGGEDDRHGARGEESQEAHGQYLAR
jgi:hypothetical protein